VDTFFEGNKIGKVCKSFGFETPPFVDLPVSHRRPKLMEKSTKLKTMLGKNKSNAAVGQVNRIDN
jgi:hypothetical protein